MRTKLIAALLAVLTTLGGLNLFQSIKKRMMPESEAKTYVVSHKRTDRVVVQKREGNRERILIRVGGEIETTVKTDIMLESVVKISSGTESMISERFTVDRGDNLIVTISHADVEIETGSSSEAEVEVRLDAYRSEKAREQFKRMNWRVYQDGDDVVVLADEVRGNWNVDMDISVHILIPSEFNVDLETSHGDLELGNLRGTLKMTSSHGDVHTADVEGDRIWVQTSHGRISGGDFSAPWVDVQTSHADIAMNSVNSKEFNATTSHADIDIESVVGVSRIVTSHGDVSVELDSADGAQIETEHGDVELRINAKTGYDLDVRAEEVSISSSLDVSGRMGEDFVDGSIAGGGAQIRVRTTHGEISVN
ncbi:MAG: DUF4097 family beta strand repeat-containing protein [Bacteroidetes bacterium]|nr:DUF4097 family beta strand repeat-containing protein [Bacteroidota bacterium]